MFLSEDGVLTASIREPFTHILKPAGTSGFDFLPAIEWQALTLGAAAGFDVPAMALVDMPDGMPPALLVERFDIRVGGDDTRMLALEDFCSVLGLPTEAKYDGTMERVARALRPLSTAPDEDLLVVFRRGLFAWLIADGDMHLKNLALLKIAEPGGDRFTEVRMSPLYDPVTTRVFPRLAHDRMALKLSGKDDRLRWADFKAFAAKAGIKASTADNAVDQMARALTSALGTLTLPPLLGRFPAAINATAEMKQIVKERIDTLT
jgi:serine/threonine-protein kinase HipA